MDNNFLTFALSPTQLKYKKILNKDFLELEIWAISDIDPNRNGTHFTTESLAKGAKTFVNKPIVGLFKRGDFGAHDGRLGRDAELDNIYWNNEYGEQILGFIRESDTVEVVQGPDGLNWIHFTCVLCIRYCYQAAKKLLKDRTKKVSVEIQVTESRFRDDGIQDILDFNLGGVTILGTKDGKAVIEAIPGAHVSIMEKLDEAVIEGQREVLCYAYQEVDGKRDINNQKSNKEGKIVDENRQTELRDLLFSNLSSYTYKKEDGTEDYRFSVGEVFDEYVMATDNATGKQYEVKYSIDANEACKFDCGELKTLAEGGCGEGEPANECNNSAEGEKCPDCGEPVGECKCSHGDGDGDGKGHDGDEDDDDDDDDDDDHVDGEPEEECKNSCDPQNECNNSCGDGEPQTECNSAGEEQRCEGCGELKSECKCTAKLMECMGELKSLQAKYEECCDELKTCKMSRDEYKARCDEMSEKVEACKDYAEIKEKLEAAESKLFSIHCEELKEKAVVLMSSEKISKEDKEAIEQKCEQGLYATEDDLIRDVSYAAFKSHLSAKSATQYQAGIVSTPQVKQEINKNQNKPEDRAKRIAEYAAGNKK